MHSPEQPLSNDFEFQLNEGLKHDDVTNKSRSRQKSDLLYERVPRDKGNLDSRHFYCTKQETSSKINTQRNNKRNADEAFASEEDTYRCSKWNSKEAFLHHEQNAGYSESDTDRKRRRVEHISRKQSLPYSDISRGRSSNRNESTKRNRQGRSHNVRPLARTLPKYGTSMKNSKTRLRSHSPLRQRGNHSVHHLRHRRQRQRY